MTIFNHQILKYKKIKFKIAFTKKNNKIEK